MSRTVADYLPMACPECQAPLQVRAEYLGKGVRCRRCKATFRAAGNLVVARLALVEGQVAALQAEAAAARQEGDRRLGDCERAAAAAAESLRAALAEATHALEEGRRRLDEQGMELVNARRAVQAGEQRARELELAHAEAERQGRLELDLAERRFQAERDGLGLELETLQVRIQAATEQRDVARDRAEGLHQERHRLVTEAREVAARSQEAQAGYQREVEQLGRLRAADADLMAGLREQLAQLQGKAETARRELDTARKQVEALSARRPARSSLDEDGFSQILASVQQEHEQEKDALRTQLAQARLDLQEIHRQVRALGLRV